jgi:hypothetical protein
MRVRFSGGIQQAGLGLVATLAASLALASAVCVSAAKPGGGGTTHTSLIYYTTNRVPTTIYQMFEDGSSKAAALPPDVVGLPSSQTYAGDRWWLKAEIEPLSGAMEVFAFRADGSASVQLTSLAADGIELGDQPRWSNDLLDSSITTHAGVWVNGVRETHVLRLPVSGAGVAAIEAGLAPRLTAADCQSLLAFPPAQVGDSQSYAGMYSCASDPSKVAYLMNNLDAEGHSIDSTISIRLLAENPGDPPLDMPIHTAAKMKLETWAHDDSRIAFYTLNSSVYGGAWTIHPDGTGLVKVISNNGTQSYRASHWSADDQELLVTIVKDRGFGVWYYNLARMPSGGGKLTILTSDLTQSQGKSPVAWVPLGP